jgi:hypothetical protein
MRAHTITTKASTTVPGGILALGLAVALMGATASTASADRYTRSPHNRAEAPHGVLGTWKCEPLSPASSWTFVDFHRCFGFPHAGDGFNFGYRPLGTSTSQRFALGAFDEETFSPRIRVSGDYAQTNNCPPVLSAPEGRVQACMIDVTFTPTGKGTRRGTLTTGPGGAKKALTGTTDPPNLHLSGKTKQSVTQEIPTHTCFENGRCHLTGVQVGVSCGHVECTARATGKLTKVKKDKLKPSRNRSAGASANLEPGQTTTVLWLKLTRNQRKQVSKALAEGKEVKAKVTVRARAATRNDGAEHVAGPVVTARRTIELVK